MTRATLSEMASKVLLIDREAARAHEEVEVFYAPGECHGDVARGHRRALEEAFQTLGWTPREFGRALRKRISMGSIFRLGFVEFMDIEAEDVARRLMETHRAHFDDLRVAGEEAKQQVDRWAQGGQVAIYVQEAMTMVRHQYDTVRDAAEDVKEEIDKWVSSYTEECMGRIGGCGRPAAYCNCP